MIVSIRIDRFDYQETMANDDALIPGKEPMILEPTPETENCDALFEPWSQGFESEAILQEDMASATLACVDDGEFE